MSTRRRKAPLRWEPASVRARRRAIAWLTLLVLVLGTGPAMAGDPDPRIRLNPIAGAASAAPGQPVPAVSVSSEARAAAAAIAEALSGRGAQGAGPASPGAAGASAAADLTRSTSGLDPDARDELRALQARAGASLDARFRVQERIARMLRGRGLGPAARGVAPGPARDRETARRFLRGTRRLLGLEDPDAELELWRSVEDRMGRRHLRFRQRYRGLEVWPADLIVHLDATGGVDALNGAHVATPRGTGATPRIRRSRALRQARNALEDGTAAVHTGSTLLIYAPGKRAPRLAWRVGLRVSLTDDWWVLIDAIDGSLLATYSRVATTGVTGSGVDLLGANRSLELWFENGSYSMSDTSKAMFDPTSNPPQPDAVRGAIVVQDAQNQPPTPNPQFLPSDMEVVRSATPNGGWIPDAVSAARNLGEVYDYYQELHGRSSLDGAGGNILAVVRLGQGYANAFFTEALNLIAFGDAAPFAGTLDVVAHELTHGITANSARLVYRDEPGALNESFSDIFGEMVEARTGGGSPDWLVGSDLSSPLRDMRNPSSLEALPGLPYPDHYEDFVVTGLDNGGVHINSSIVNRAFYLLAEGLPGAVGLADAEQIFYRALTLHLSRSSRFADARLAAVLAAEELFGVGSSQALRTAEAFETVGILDAAPDPPPEFPGTEGEDATLFLYRDPTRQDCLALGPADGQTWCLARREGPDDPPLGVAIAQYEVARARPSASGDGELAAFVDPTGDLCFIRTDASETELCLFLPQSQIWVASVAVSPDESRFGFVLADSQQMPQNVLYVMDLDDPAGDPQAFPLVAPALDGGTVATVRFADAMDFASDGRFVIYDAFNEFTLAGGESVGAWSIYAIDIATGTTFSVVPPIAGLDFAYPSLSQTSDSFLVFDAFDQATGEATVYAGSLETGDLAVLGQTTGFGVPGYVGDDSAVVFSQDDARLGLVTATGHSLVAQAVDVDRITPQGPVQLWLRDGDFGVIYRRGVFIPEPGGAALCLAALAGLILCRMGRRRSASQSV